MLNKSLIKELSYLSLSILFMSSCGNGLTKVIEKSESGEVYKTYRVDKDSLIQGEYLVYYEDGASLFEKSHYENDFLQGIRTLYYQDGAIEIIEHYDKGVLVDTLLVFYENGNRMREVPYTNGAINGELQTYHENGNLKEKVVFQDNLENGPFEEYYENGSIMWKGSFLNGDNEFGELLHYDLTGTLDRKLTCDSNAICTTIWAAAED